jgi:hypothetical protein
MTQAPRLTGVRALGALMDLGYAPIHDLAGPIADAIADEAGGIIWVATQRMQLASAQFMSSWWRLVRRIVLGTLAETPARGAVDPVGQVPQWLRTDKTCWYADQLMVWS